MNKPKTLADRPRAHTREAKPLTLFRATLETRHFSFEAFDSDHNGAWGALVQGLKRHGRQYQIGENWFVEFIADIDVNEIKIGQAYRGPEEIPL